MLEAMKKQLREDWRLVWRTWSFRLSVVGAFVTSLLIAAPDLALQVWAMLPADLKATIPPQYMPYVGVAIGLLGIVAKFLKQAKLEAERQKQQP